MGGGGGTARPSDDYRPGASTVSPPPGQIASGDSRSQTPPTSGPPVTKPPQPSSQNEVKGVAGRSHDPKVDGPTPSATPTGQLGSMFSRLRRRVTETAAGLQQAPPTEDHGSKVS